MFATNSWVLHSRIIIIIMYLNYCNELNELTNSSTNPPCEVLFYLQQIRKRETFKNVYNASNSYYIKYGDLANVYVHINVFTESRNFPNARVFISYSVGLLVFDSTTPIENRLPNLQYLGKTSFQYQFRYQRMRLD